MSDMHHYETAISKIVSNQHEEELILRGHRLSDLIREASFAQSVFLMLAGHMPSAGQARTLDAVFTACVDHAITPAAMIGRAFASYGTSVPAAIAGGILMFGDITGGAGEPLANIMLAAIGEAVQSGQVIDDDQLQLAAGKIVGDALGGSGRMPGFGIPAHAKDPRAPALLEVAREQGAAGPYCRLLVCIEQELARVKGRPIPINIDGIVAAIVLDFGLPAGCAAAFVMIPRSFSTLAHHLEERAQQTRWRHVPQEHVTYTGPMP
ncbi:MAG: citryl-CoA lyase [Burkholderiales bacterium]